MESQLHVEHVIINENEAITFKSNISLASSCLVVRSFRCLPHSSAKYSNESFDSEKYSKSEVPIPKRSRTPSLYLTALLVQPLVIDTYLPTKICFKKDVKYVMVF